MNVKDLRTLVDNLDEYIHVPGGVERLKKSILHLAVSGQLVPQDASEGTGQELYEQIQAGKAKLITGSRLRKHMPLQEVSDEEKPFQIPDSWKWTRLGEMIQVSSGSFLPSPEMADNYTYPVYGGNGISGYYDRYLYEDPVVVIGRVGAQCGNAHITLPNAWVTDNAFVVRYAERSISREYLVITIRQLDLKRTHKGSAQPVISGKSIYPLPFQLPPFNEQLRIVKKIEDMFLLIDDLSRKYNVEQDLRRKLVISSLVKLGKGDSTVALELLTDIIRSNADVSELRKTILHLAVSGQLVPQDPSEGTGQELREQIQTEKSKLIAEGKLKKQALIPEINKEEIRFEIPKSWRWVRMPEIYISHSPKTKLKTDAYLEKGRYPIIDQGKRYIAGYTDSGIVNAVTTPVVIFGDHTREVKLVDFDFIVGADGVKILEPVLVDSRFFYMLVDVFRPQTRGYGRHFKMLNEKVVPLPPLAEQSRVVTKTTQLLDLVTQLEKHLEPQK